MPLEEIADDIAAVLQGALAEGWNQLNTFQKSQSNKLAKQAALLAQLRVSGELREDETTFEFLLEQLEDKVENFAIAVANLTVLTLQRAWNAVVGVIWKAINELLTGAGLSAVPVPSR